MLTPSHRTRGFTIVELLIVIVVIAILAAISVVAYNGIQNRAYDAAVRNDLTNFAKLMELYKLDNGGYPARNSLAATLGGRLTKTAYDTTSGHDNGSATGRNASYCAPSDSVSGSRYTLVVTSKSKTQFSLVDGAVVQRSWSVVGWGICNLIGRASTEPNHGWSSSRTPDQAWSTWTD